MLLQNGAMMKNDVIEAFARAVNDPDNLHQGGGVNWDFVDADLYLDLGNVYAAEYLNECFEVLVDNYYSI